MKKRLLLFLLAISFLFLCGCSAAVDEPIVVPDMDIPFEMYSAGGFNHYCPVKILSEKRIESGGSSYFINEAAAPEKTVTVFGKTYTGRYDESIKFHWTSFVADYYYAEEGVSFAVETGTDRVVELLFFDAFSEEHDQMPELENQEELVVAYARELAATLENLERYEMFVMHDTEGAVEGKPTYYYVSFRKMINGMRSMEFLSFKISSKGVMAMFTAGERRETFDKLDSTELTPENVDTCVQYTASKSGASCSYYCKGIKYDDQVVILTPQGEYGVVSTFTVDWEHSKTKETCQGIYRLFSKYGDRSVIQAAPTG